MIRELSPSHPAQNLARIAFWEAKTNNNGSQWWFHATTVSHDRNAFQVHLGCLTDTNLSYMSIVVY